MNSKEYELFVNGQINYFCSKLEELYSEIGMNIGYSDKPTVSLYKNKDEVRELVSTHVRSSYQLVQQVETFDVTLDSNPSLDDLIIYDGKVSVGGIRQSITELGLEFYLIKKVIIMAENKEEYDAMVLNLIPTYTDIAPYDENLKRHEDLVAKHGWKGVLRAEVIVAVLPYGEYFFIRHRSLPTGCTFTGHVSDHLSPVK